MKKFRSDSEKINIVTSIIDSGKSTRTMCEFFGIRPNQFYTWRDQLVSKDSSNVRRRIMVPKLPKVDTTFEVFKSECDDQIKSVLTKMFNQWKENDLIFKIKSKVTTPEQITELSKVVGIEELSIRMFLERKFNEIKFQHVNKMLKHLEIVV